MNTVTTVSVRTLTNNYFGGCTNIYDTKKKKKFYTTFLQLRLIKNKR